MAVSRVTQASAQTTSASISTPQSGDVILVFAHRDGSTTAPTLDANYTSLATPSGSTNSARIAFRVSNGSETTCGTWTNATSVTCEVWRGTDQLPAKWGIVTATGSSATLSFSALALKVPDGNSWVSAYAGHRTATNVGTNAPTGMTTESSATDVAAFSTEAVKRSWAVQTASVNATSGWVTAVVEIVAAAPSYGTPAIVQACSGSNTGQLSSGTSSYTLPFAHPIQNGNAVFVASQVDNTGSPTLTASDDAGNTYVSAATVVDATNGQLFAILYALNVTGSPRVVTVLGGAATFGSKQVIGIELVNAYRVDVTGTNTGGSSTSITAGSMTPSVSGDYLWHVAGQMPATTSTTMIYTVGSQANITWAWATSSDPQGSPMISQGGVYNSTSAINPTFTQSTSRHFCSLAVAIQGGIRGANAPAGMRIAAIQHQSLWSTSRSGPGYPTTCPLIFPPTVGNLKVGFAFCAGGETITAVSDSVDGSWTALTGTTSGQHWTNVFYKEGATPGACTVTVTVSANADNHTFILYDIVGARSSGALDVRNTLGGDTGTTTNATITGASVTPTTSSGLILGQINHEFNTVVSCSTPSGSLFDATVDAAESNDGPVGNDQNMGLAHLWNTDTSAKAFVWTYKNASGDAQHQWLSDMVAFKAPAAASLIPNPKAVLQAVNRASTF